MARDDKATSRFLRPGDDAGGRVQVYYFDGAGVSWRAYERRVPDQKPALVFESAHAIRIVRDYPDNWHTLPRAALEALSWSV
jgi:hypothetical protein